MKSLLFAALAAGNTYAAGTCSMHSPPHRVALLELYTSEGCSSCPPADAFLSGLRTALRPDQAVPLSLHVDYWNYIGWKDPYSRRTFTDRQHWLSELAGARAVYTPEFFVAGRELRGWQGGMQAAVARVNQQQALADISIALAPAEGGALALDVAASARTGGKLYVALVESGVSSQVRAGENSGRLLRHDYVVREWLPPLALAAGVGVGSGAAPGFSARVVRTLPLPSGATAGRLSVSAFVQSEQGDVLQAATLPACGS